MSYVYLVAAVLAVSSTCAKASVGVEADFHATYQSAYSAFEKRGDAANKNVGLCIQRAQAAQEQATDVVERFDATVLEARCTYFWAGKQDSRGDKLAVYQQGMEVGKRAIALQPERAEGYYYYGISLARWGRTKGILKALDRRHELFRMMDLVKSKMAKDDQGRDIPGREYDGWGANRTAGITYKRLPPGSDGDTVKAERLLREAVEKMSKQYPNSLNVVFLAETLIENKKKDEARQILDELIQYESMPEKYNAHRVPETLEDIKEARELRSDL